MATYRSNHLQRSSAYPMNIKSSRHVELIRGRNGFGFTISSQQPCVLNHIVNGSPAALVGLKPGDLLLNVNGKDVSHASHDDVVRLVGCSGSCITLTIGENFTNSSSDSSSDEYSYGHKVRNAYTNSYTDKRSNPSLYKKSNVHSSRYPLSSKQYLHERSTKVTRNNRYENNERNKIVDNVAESENLNPMLNYGLHSRHSAYSSNPPVKHTVITKAQRLGQPITKYTSPHPTNTNYGNQGFADRAPNNIKSMISIENNIKKSKQNSDLCQNFEAVVGYVGSIDLPGDVRIKKTNMQSIKNAVKRLRLEGRVNKFVLLSANEEGIKLFGNACKLITFYEAAVVAACGICTDDKRFFAILTTDQADDDAFDDVDSDVPYPLARSCHIFMVDPELSSHKVHAIHMQRFGLQCAVSDNKWLCDLFPNLATPLVAYIADNSCTQYGWPLYEGLLVQLGFLSAAVLSELNSQNSSSISASDSGASYFKDDSCDRDACIVDVSSSNDVDTSTLSVDIPVLETSADLNHAFAVTDNKSSHDKPNNSIVSSNAKALSGSQILQDKCIVSETVSAAQSLTNKSNKENNVPAKKSFILESKIISSQSQQPMTTESLTFSDNKLLFHENKLFSKKGYTVFHERHTENKRSRVLRPKSTSVIPKDVEFEYILPNVDNISTEKTDGLVKYRNVENSVSKMQDRKSMFDDVNFQLEKSKKALSNSHESLLGLDSRRPEQSIGSLALSTCELDVVQNRVALWATNFDHLLTNDVGRVVFAEFLRQEFSEENLIFWKKCEDFKKITDDTELKRMAQLIYKQHLENHAPELVNVDSEARIATEQYLANPTPDIFDIAQKQIHKLMKMDSYQRFLKSDLFKACMLAEIEGRPLPVELTAETSKHVPCENKKDFVKVKDKEEKRRKSLLPWNRGKTEKHMQKVFTEPNLSKNDEDSNAIELSKFHKRLSFGGQTVVGNSKEPNQFEEKETMKSKAMCTVVFPDGSSLTVSCNNSDVTSSVISRLCERRGLHMCRLEILNAFSAESIKPSSSLISYSSCGIRLEKRVIFRLDIILLKCALGIRVRPTHSVRTAIVPIAERLEVDVNDCLVGIHGKKEFVSWDASVENLDGKRVVLQSIAFNKDHKIGSKPPVPFKLESHLEQQLNKFLSGSLLVEFDDLGIWYPSIKDSKSTNEGKNFGIFNFIKRHKDDDSKDRNSMNDKKIKGNNKRNIDSSQTKAQMADDHEVGSVNSESSCNSETSQKLTVSRNASSLSENSSINASHKGLTNMEPCDPGKTNVVPETYDESISSDLSDAKSDKIHNATKVCSAINGSEIVEELKQCCDSEGQTDELKSKLNEQLTNEKCGQQQAYSKPSVMSAVQKDSQLEYTSKEINYERRSQNLENSLSLSSSQIMDCSSSLGSLSIPLNVLEDKVESIVQPNLANESESSPSKPAENYISKIVAQNFMRKKKGVSDQKNDLNAIIVSTIPVIDKKQTPAPASTMLEMKQAPTLTTTDKRQTSPVSVLQNNTAALVPKMMLHDFSNVTLKNVSSTQITNPASSAESNGQIALVEPPRMKPLSNNITTASGLMHSLPQYLTTSVAPVRNLLADLSSSHKQPDSSVVISSSSKRLSTTANIYSLNQQPVNVQVDRDKVSMAPVRQLPTEVSSSSYLPSSHPDDYDTHSFSTSLLTSDLSIFEDCSNREGLCSNINASQLSISDSWIASDDLSSAMPHSVASLSSSTSSNVMTKNNSILNHFTGISSNTKLRPTNHINSTVVSSVANSSTTLSYAVGAPPPVLKANSPRGLNAADNSMISYFDTASQCEFNIMPDLSPMHIPDYVNLSNNECLSMTKQPDLSPRKRQIQLAMTLNVSNAYIPDGSFQYADDEDIGNIGYEQAHVSSPTSTPSPTTHDLILDSLAYTVTPNYDSYATSYNNNSLVSRSLSINSSENDDINASYV